MSGGEAFKVTNDINHRTRVGAEREGEAKPEELELVLGELEG